MKYLNKGSVFISVLLFLALIEGSVLIYDLFHPFRNEFTLDSYTQEIAPRDTKVKPFLFEEKFADQVDHIAAQYAQEMSDDLFHKIVGQLNVSPKQTEDNLSLFEDEIKEDDTINAEDLPENLLPPADKEALEPLNAPVNSTANENKPLIAVVIDDMGISPSHTKAIIDIQKPMTASFLTYDPAGRKQVQAAKDAGFEVMLHVPMMPHSRKFLAPITLAPEMSKEQIQTELKKMIARYEGMGMRGINNHMGSLFTETPEAMSAVMEILQQKEMFFLDSLTTGKSVGRRTARQYGVAFLSRDVFLDNENNYDYIMGQLHQTEKIAAKKGYAVAIGHPHDQTAKALKDWVETLEEKGFVLVHISDLINKK